MNDSQAHVAILIGSPKGVELSNSARVARLITDGLEAAHWTREWFHVHRAVDSPNLWDAMVESVMRADVVLIAAPLFVDSLPSPLIKTLHRLREAKNLPAREDNPPRLLALLNCGFVEPDHNRYAQLMLRAFSDSMGFQWVGGISLGMSGMITKRLRAAMEKVSESLREDILIPDSVVSATITPILRPWLYVLGGNLMWRRQAKGNGLDRKSLKARPYEVLTAR